MTEDQENELRRLGRLAILSLAAQLINDADEIIDLAIERASTIGVREYGDTAYHKPVEYLEIDVLEELADAVFYRHIILIDEAERGLHG